METFLYGMLAGFVLCIAVLFLIDRILKDVPKVYFAEDNPRLEDEELNDYLS